MCGGNRPPDFEYALIDNRISRAHADASGAKKGGGSRPSAGTPCKGRPPLKARHQAEGFFGKLEQFWRITLRFEKTMGKNKGLGRSF